MSRLPLLPVAAALLFACSDPTAGDSTAIAYDPCQPLTVTTVGATSSLQRQAIDDAIAMWRDAMPNTALDRDGDGESLPVEFRAAAPFFHGIYVAHEGVILVNSGITERRALAITLAHELGHAFGLEHADGGMSVMIRGNADIEPAAADVRALEARWGACRRSPATLAAP